MFRSLVPWRERTMNPWPEGFSRTLSRMDEEFDELMERLFRSEEGRLDPTPE
jgi:hypothetical protein